MSRLFFDHLTSFPRLEIIIKQVALSKDEQEELWDLVEEIVHHKILHIILDTLPHEHHFEFLEEFSKAPHDETHIIFINERSGQNIEEIIASEMGELEEELLAELISTQKRVH
jgi:hypothetical protein